jgi:hypothetical protein
MVRLPTGTSPSTLDWTWQKVDPDRHVESQDDLRCINCHLDCGGPPDGWDGACTIP